jgi:hypothetical protein
MLRRQGFIGTSKGIVLSNKSLFLDGFECPRIPIVHRNDHVVVTCFDYESYCLPFFSSILHQLSSISRVERLSAEPQWEIE